mmetsp:Transcript_22078/g.42913  ORF Transcript_22078/g.42913 Transcript_22078/m.42913 type:complete len:569 (+) Transcript_22078:93-1799(+)
MGRLPNETPKEQRIQLTKMGASAAAILSTQIQDHLSPAENAAELLKHFVESHERSLSAPDIATINFAVSILTLDPTDSAAVPSGLQQTADKTNGETKDEEDEEVKEWLRADFTRLAHSSTTDRHDMRAKMKKVGLGLVAGKKLANIMGTRSADDAALPFECPESEQKAIMDCLKGVGEWNWDIFALKKASHHRELQVLGWHFMQYWQLITNLNVDPQAMQKWLRFVQSQYNETEYHSLTHASDVLQAVFFMLTKAGVEKYLSELEIFALLVAVMVHDLGHDGMNNNFHKNAKTDRALTHNDVSIQENHHIMTVFTHMHKNKDINILAGFDAAQTAEIRRIIIAVVLATDMSKHFVFMKDFQNLIEKKGQSVEEWHDSTDIIMQAVMHICDISNPARPRDLAIAWTDRCLAEFFRQGDLEKSMGLVVSPQCNRDTTSRAASQIGFIKFIVHPSYTVLSALLPEVEAKCLVELNKNLEYWTEQAEIEKRSKGTNSMPGTPSQTKSAKGGNVADSPTPDRGGESKGKEANGSQTANGSQKTASQTANGNPTATGSPDMKPNMLSPLSVVDE